MRYDYIVAVGVALMVVGGVIVAVGEAKVDVASRASYIYIPRYEVERPGTYWMNTTNDVSTYIGWASLRGGTASLFLPSSFPSNCEGAKVFELKARGSIAAGKPGYLVVRVTATLADNETARVVEYRVNITPPPRQAAPTGTVIVPLVANGSETIGYIASRPGAREAEIVIPLMRGEVPPTTRIVTVEFNSSLPGKLQVELTTGYACEGYHRVGSPFLVPAGYEVQQITTPSKISINTATLRAGTALIALGNAVAILGVYGKLSHRGEGERRGPEAR
ncbi:MAG: hypothetical protein GSR80_001385 [Desulfurococcales archaeon]|nr:hypothetical protein [Desulfurococcales archaeon]